jgi:teichuronic acid exporter
MSVSLKDQIVSGASWSVLAQLLTQVLKVAFTFTMARHFLAPEDFGDVATVTFFTGVGLVISNFGFGQYLVVKEIDINSNHTHSVFWLNLFIGLILGISFHGSATFLASYFGRDSLISVVQLMSTIFLISALTVIPKVNLTKSMKFKKIAIVDCLAISIASLISIYLAWRGWGVISLATYYVLTPAIMCLGYWAYTNFWIPKLILKREDLKQGMKFSINLLSNQSLNYFTGNVDRVFISKYMGSGLLGYYGQSMSLVMLPVNQVSTALTKVLFPGFVKMKDIKQISRVQVRLVRYVFWAVGGILLLISIHSELLVVTFLGNKWIPMSEILSLTCFLAIIIALRSSFNSLFLSQERTDLLFKINLVSRILIFTAMALSVTIGIETFIKALIFAYFLSLLILLFHASRLMGLTLLSFGQKLLKVTLALTFTYGLVYVLTAYFIEPSYGTIFLYVVLYLFISWLLKVELDEELKLIKFYLSKFSPRILKK